MSGRKREHDRVETRQEFDCCNVQDQENEASG